MKNSILTKIFVMTAISANAGAADCISELVNHLQYDANIQMTKVVRQYGCGQDACAVIYERESSVCPNPSVMAFLDLKNGYEVRYAAINSDGAEGSQRFSRQTSTHLYSRSPWASSMNVNISVEANQDVMFSTGTRPVFAFKTYNCSKF